MLSAIRRISWLTGWVGSSWTSATPRFTEMGTDRDEGIWALIVSVMLSMRAGSATGATAAGEGGAY